MLNCNKLFPLHFEHNANTVYRQLVTPIVSRLVTYDTFSAADKIISFWKMEYWLYVGLAPAVLKKFAKHSEQSVYR